MLGEEGGGGLRHLWAAAESADGHTCCLLLSTSLYTKLRYKVLYTDTRCVTDLHSYTAIQRYTLYNLYNIPLSGWVPARTSACTGLSTGARWCTN